MQGDCGLAEDFSTKVFPCSFISGKHRCCGLGSRCRKQRCLCLGMAPSSLALLGFAELPTSLKLCGESRRLCWVQGLVPVQLCELLLQKT